MVSITDTVAAASVLLAIGRPSAAVVSARLHPVAADGHRAPPRVIGLAAVDQEQPALGVRARAQPAGLEIRSASHASTARAAPSGPPSTSSCQSNPSAPADRAQLHGARNALQGRRASPRRARLSAGPTRASRSAGELGLGGRDAALAHPRSRRLRVREIVVRHPVDDRRGVEQVEQQLPRPTAPPRSDPYLTSKLLLTGYRTRSSLSLTIKTD